jgi:hypothetical protein
MAAWSVFDVESREAYRAALGFVDDAIWARGCASAVSAALMALPYYRDTNPDIAPFVAGHPRGPRGLTG